jgi:hypothetical protein
MDLVRVGRMSRRLIVNARKLDYFDAQQVRLVMSVSDVTEARINEKLKDDLLHERRSCCRSSSIGLPTASRSSPACSCRVPGGCVPSRPEATFVTRATG